MESDSRPSLCPDTTRRSALHWLAGYGRCVDARPPLVRIYVAAAALAYLPVLVAAALEPLPLWTNDPCVLPFLRDWGLGFGLLISFPTLLVLFVHDQRALCDALRQVQRDGVIETSAPIAQSLTTEWEGKFGTSNFWSHVAAIVGGIALATVTLWLYQQQPYHSWNVPKAHVAMVGIAYAYGIALLYGMVILYVWRCITISAFLRDLVATTKLRLLPFHPDKCGGLRPVGQIGLRNQYILTTLGINIVLLLLVWWLRADHEDPLRVVMILAPVAYFICGPLVFMGPLLPFRQGMLEAKREWSSEVAGLLRAEFEQLRDRIKLRTLASTDEEALDRLRKLGTVIDELPVWPFDARTLRTFATAYVVPLGLPIVGKLILVAIGL